MVVTASATRQAGYTRSWFPTEVVGANTHGQLKAAPFLCTSQMQSLHQVCSGTGVDQRQNENDGKSNRFASHVQILIELIVSADDRQAYCSGVGSATGATDSDSTDSGMSVTMSLLS